ncbi:MULTISPECIES: hypothetical protein [Corallococcus]|uniref:hypothetical protein n=1 Tax=Corallococcus TaxID=83461 RepID=UPI0011C4A474|nr:MULTISPECIES: hypothetical protein [Corallococcus]
MNHPSSTSLPTPNPQEYPPSSWRESLTHASPGILLFVTALWTSNEENKFALILFAAIGSLGFQLILHLALMTSIYYANRIARGYDYHPDKEWRHKERHTMTGAVFLAAAIFCQSTYSGYAEKQRIKKCVQEAKNNPYWKITGEPMSASSIISQCTENRQN